METFASTTLWTTREGSIILKSHMNSNGPKTITVKGREFQALPTFVGVAIGLGVGLVDGLFLTLLFLSLIFLPLLMLIGFIIYVCGALFVGEKFTQPVKKKLKHCNQNFKLSHFVFGIIIGAILAFIGMILLAVISMLLFIVESILILITIIFIVVIIGAIIYFARRKTKGTDNSK